MSRTIIPFGPQHPVLPEPIHLQLVMDNETVVEALPKLGYVHRGLETLTTLRDYNQMIYIVERVCGICSCIHALCFCRAIEHLMDVEVPRRAAYLRIIWSELHRMHSHLLWLGLFADALGFESLFMQFWKIRERIMDINEATAGNRVIISTNIVGGVRKDLSREHQRWILDEMDTLEAEMRRLEKVTMAPPGRPCAAAAWLRTCARRNTKPSRNSGSRPCPSSTATAGPVPRSASSKCSSPWKSSARPSATCPTRKST